MKKTIILQHSDISGDWLHRGRLFCCVTAMEETFPDTIDREEITVEISDEPFENARRIIFESCTNKNDPEEPGFCITLDNGDSWDELYGALVDMCLALKTAWLTDIFYVKVSV